MSSQVVTYRVDDATTVKLEIEPAEGFQPTASAGEVIGRVQDAVTPAIEAAWVAGSRAIGLDTGILVIKPNLAA